MNIFYHQDHTRETIDVRHTPSSGFDLSSVFYLAYRVKLGNAIWYHHAMILADTFETFMKGTTNLQNKILTSLHQEAEVSLLFVRNLYSDDKSIVESAFGQNIIQEMTADLSTNRVTDDDFLVFGLIGQEQNRMTLMNVSVTDARTAIEKAHDHIHDMMTEPFAPLDVCLIHPVTHEFLARYKATVGRFMALLGEPSEAALTQH